MIGVDTNLLVYAHRAATPEHEEARRALERAMEDPRGWGFTAGCALEFWHVVTQARMPGRPSTPREARNFVARLVDRGQAVVWLPHGDFIGRVFDAAARLGVTGARVFDLQHAITALDNGASEMWTHDADFVRLPGLSVHDPLVER